MIIDAHAHTFPDKIAERAIQRLEKISGIKAATNGTVADTFGYKKKEKNYKFFNINNATSTPQQYKIKNTSS